LPVEAVKDVPDRTRYAFKDKPGGPSVPDDSILLWVTPNYPLHLDDRNVLEGLVKMYVPFFLAPSMKGGLFEIIHFVEVSVLPRGEFDLKFKRIPLNIVKTEGMPCTIGPAIGDGYEQNDFNLAPSHQATPHGRRASGWEAVDLVNRKVARKNASGFFRSRRTFRISFNNHHSAEISLHGEWMGDLHIIQEGQPLHAHFGFDHSQVSVKRFTCRLVRVEKLYLKDERILETTVSETVPVCVHPFLTETSHTVFLPLNICASFTSDLVSVSYRLDFELHALDSVSQNLLEPVVWSLPTVIQARDENDDKVNTHTEPYHPFGSIEGLIENFDEESRITPPVNSEVEQVKQRSYINPGSMRFVIHI
jgi:hypothetical protein